MNALGKHANAAAGLGEITAGDLGSWFIADTKLCERSLSTG